MGVYENISNYTINGEPVALYAMIGVTTLLLSYVTFMGPSNEKGEKADEDESKKDESEEKEENEQEEEKEGEENEPEEESSTTEEEKKEEDVIVPSVGMMPQPIPLGEPAPVEKTESLQNKPESEQEKEPEKTADGGKKWSNTKRRKSGRRKSKRSKRRA